MTTAVKSSFTDTVRGIFADITRYPLEILEPDASLEEDLGIDSVKLGEVFAVLRERYKLSDQPAIPREQLRTIGLISQALEEYLNGSGHAPVMPAAEPVALPAAAPVVSPADFQTAVREVFAGVT